MSSEIYTTTADNADQSLACPTTKSTTVQSSALPPELISRIFSHADPSTLLLVLRTLSSYWRNEIDTHVLPNLFGRGEWRVGLRIAKKPRVGHLWRGQLWRGPTESRSAAEHHETSNGFSNGQPAAANVANEQQSSGLANTSTVESTPSTSADASASRGTADNLPEVVQARRRIVESQLGALEDELDAFPGNPGSRAGTSAASSEDASSAEDSKHLVHVLPLSFKGVVKGGLTFGTPTGEYHALFEHATLPRGFERGAASNSLPTNGQVGAGDVAGQGARPVTANGAGHPPQQEEAGQPAAAAPAPASAPAPDPAHAEMVQQQRDNARLLLNFGIVWRFPGDGTEDDEEWGMPDPEHGWLSQFYCSKADVRPIPGPTVEQPTLSESEDSDSDSSDDEDELEDMRGSGTLYLSGSSAGPRSQRHGSTDKELLPSERIMLAEGIAPPPRSQQVTGHSTPIARRVRQMVDAGGSRVDSSGFASTRAATAGAANPTAPSLDWSDMGVEYIRLDLTLGNEFFARRSHRANRLLRRLQDEASGEFRPGGVSRNASRKAEDKGKQRARPSGSSTPGHPPVAGLTSARAPSARSSGINTPSYSSAASTPLRPKALGGALARLAAQQAAVVSAPAASIPALGSDQASHPTSTAASPRMSELSLGSSQNAMGNGRPTTPHRSKPTPRSSSSQGGASTPSKYLGVNPVSTSAGTNSARLGSSSGRSTGASTPARMQRNGTSSAGRGRKANVEPSMPRAKFRAHLVKAEDLKPAEPSTDAGRRSSEWDREEDRKLDSGLDAGRLTNQNGAAANGNGWRGKTAWGTGAWRHAMLDTDQPAGLLWSWSR
ncbi:hypothetical protein IE81DRAFT_30159 [Ceraceosorus guamensis]|uniref:F-box domain-containing protein n=1 Tax=Ceraceosorus guamensis TaxID=1522189 RepID=A0A316W6F3_9BASI|nr:hypothetical protein IE81DRAFT_30159 [Ceraceosorus guamensis]PWN44321.1 hypothetical protein IE81DRAFT_30159 [Ceraceosorus guamensis]